MKSYVDGLVLVGLLTLGGAAGLYGAHRVREAFRFNKTVSPAVVLRIEPKPECTPALTALIGVAPVAACPSCQRGDYLATIEQ